MTQPERLGDTEEWAEWAVLYLESIEGQVI
jgi:hypothetical protein